MKGHLKCVSIVLLFGMLFSLFGVYSSAVSVNIPSRELVYFAGIDDKRVEIYPKISVSIGGVSISDRAYLINETTYVPLRAATEISGAQVSYNAKTRAATVTRADLVMTVTDGSYIVEANGRILLSKTPAVILSDGKMYIPIRSLAKALSLEVEWQPPAKVSLRGTARGLASAEEYYKSDELYWLSKIISAESRGEPLLGQIAVGNVVLNRMRSRDYPNTIYGVIFDRKYGVQFSPVKDGSIYMTATYSSVMAAKICLEGISVSEGILFFMQPQISTSSWILNNRKYAFTIGNHYFFY
jgi:N-acetylmuramoyl-L-alanine amidase